MYNSICCVYNSYSIYDQHDFENIYIWKSQSPVDICTWFLFQHSNHMNTSLLTLYRKGNPDSLPSSPKNDLMMSITPSQAMSRSDIIASPQAPSVTKISEGGWFIDKTPGPKEENFFIDLCAEEECDNIKQKAEVFFLMSLCPFPLSHTKSLKINNNF